VRNLTTHKALLFVLVLIPIVASAALVSRVTNFSDGQVLTAAQLNSEFNNLVDGVNNIDNTNIATGAAISPSKLAASIAGDGIARDGSSGVLSVGVDGSSIEISSDALRVKAAGITGAMLATSAADATTLEVASSSMRIKDLGVSTAKIADLAVTNAKLAALNYSISASDSGTFSTNSTAATGVAVTNLTVSITTSGRPVLVYMQSNSTDSTEFPGVRTDSTIGTVFFRRDATNIVANSISGGGSLTQSPCSAFSYIDAPAAGTYTYTARANTSSGGATELEVHQCKLVAREL
jgi:hypothetical protein